MIETKKIFIQKDNCDINECLLTISKSAPWKISFSGANLYSDSQNFEGDSLFDAFNNLRTQLEKFGYKVLCNGARKNVLLSGMSRSMGGGRKAYVVEIGSPARMKNLVDIFDYAEPNLVTSRKEQQEYGKKWIESLK